MKKAFAFAGLRFIAVPAIVAAFALLSMTSVPVHAAISQDRWGAIVLTGQQFQLWREGQLRGRAACVPKGNEMVGSRLVAQCVCVSGQAIQQTRTWARVNPGPRRPCPGAAGTAQFPNLAGGWRCVQNCYAGTPGQPTSIAQGGNALTFNNGNRSGNISQGVFLNQTTVRATQWNVTATIENGGRRLRWSNGTIWTR